jgi:hypothetical protein
MNSSSNLNLKITGGIHVVPPRNVAVQASDTLAKPEIKKNI